MDTRSPRGGENGEEMAGTDWDRLMRLHTAIVLETALERLGFGPCYHMVEVLKRPRDAAFWDEAADKVDRGERVNWDKVFSDYEATVDWPGCNFYRELVEAYPDAKVILSVRDPYK